MIIGQYPLNSFKDAFKLFVYPTNYIFLVWLLICYCIFYFVAYTDRKINRFLETTMVVIFFVWILVYVLFYDKDVYRIDNVDEPFILFLYIESMLMGALFKKGHSKISVGMVRTSKIVIAFGCLAIYFVSKIIFSRVEAVLPLQIINQFVILITLFSVFDLFISLEQKFKNIPEKINCVVKHISNITLQIYVVQFVIIRYCEKLWFPLNLIVVVSAIIVVATALYYLEVIIRKFIDFLLSKARK